MNERVVQQVAVEEEEEQVARTQAGSCKDEDRG